jgi:hypothetical protein
MGENGKKPVVLRTVWLSDESNDPGGAVRYSYAQCRLTHVNDREFEAQEGDDPVVGLQVGQDRPTRMAKLSHAYEPFKLALDIQRLEQLLEPERALYPGKTLTLTLKLQRITKNHAVARETAVEYHEPVENPFWRVASAGEESLQDQDAADDFLAADHPGPAIAAEDLPASEPDIGPPERYRAEQGNPHLFISSAGEDGKWEDVSTLVQTLNAAVPVLETWPEEYLPLLMLRTDSSQPYLTTTVTFAARFSSQAQMLGTGLVLMQEGDTNNPLHCRMFANKTIDEKGKDAVELQWSWKIRPDRPYVLCLTSRSEWFLAPHLLFSPVTPFMEETKAELVPFKLEVWLDGQARRGCAWARPVRTTGPGGTISKAELCDFVAVAVSPSRSVHVVRLGDRPEKPLKFEVKGAVPASVIVRRLARDSDDARKRSIRVAFSKHYDVFGNYLRDGATHWVSPLDGPPETDAHRTDFPVARELGFSNGSQESLVPIEVTFKPRRRRTVLAIDIGASAIAAAIATTESPMEKVLLLPIGKVNEERDPADKDADNPDFVSARVAVSILSARALRKMPWHAVDPSADPKLRDADAELFLPPSDEQKVRKRLLASADEDRPGRRIEVHLPVWLNVREDGDGVRVVSDLKMAICRNHLLRDVGAISVQPRQPGPGETGRDLPTADLLEHVIELLLSIYVPDAVDRVGPAIRRVGLQSADEWDALFTGDDERHFVLVLSHPASIDSDALRRYLKAATKALLQHFGSSVSDIGADGQIRCRRVSEALAVDAALRHVLPHFFGNPQDHSHRIVIDIGSATTDVAVIDYPKRGGWGEVIVSFALPIAAKALRRWIAMDIRRAASPEQLRDLLVLGNSREGVTGLDQQIEDAIRKSADTDGHLAVYLATSARPVAMPAVHDDDGAIRIVPVDGTDPKTEFVAFVPIHKAPRPRHPLLFHHGLDVLAAVIAKGVAVAFDGKNFDVPVEIVLSGRGAAFEPLGHAIQNEIRKLDHGGELRVSTVGELLCGDHSDKATRLRKMKSVVAEGAAARALAIELGFAGELVVIPAARHAIVVGFVDADDEPLVFDHINEIHPLDRPGTILRAERQFWVARIIPGLKAKDFPSLLRRDAGRIAADSADGVALEIARACIVPLRKIGKGTNSIKWDYEPDSLTIIGSTGVAEQLRLRDDGSYA